jgi:tetratricopeptide (TPR) repeat protein
LGPSAPERSWEAAHALEREGKLEEANLVYRSLCQGVPPYVRGCHDEAMVLFDAGQLDAARSAATKVIEAFPDDAGIRSLVRALSRSFEEQGEVAAGAAQLEKLAEAVTGTEACDTVRWELALLWKRAGQADAETATLEELVAKTKDRWSSQVWDDAVWRLAELMRLKGDVASQERWLRILLDARRKSRLIGSYASPYDDKALWALAQLRWARGDALKALEALEELRGMESSRLRDDAAVLAAGWLHELGLAAQACEVLFEVIEGMPEASERRTALELADQWHCTSSGS